MFNKDKDPQHKLAIKEKLRLKKKEAKKIQTAKRARLVVKNLSFEANEQNIKEYFEKFGEVTEVNLLRKPDGKLVGCAFIQFKLVQKAAKARHHTNGKEFLGRNIDVDFVLSKDIYKKKVEKEHNHEDVAIKHEVADVDLSIVKEEIDEEIKPDPDAPATIIGDIKEEEDDFENEVNEILESEVEPDEEETDTEDSENESEDDSDKSNQDDETNTDDSSEAEENAEENENKELSTDKKPRVISNDVQEGKTVFVKNIPFSATKDDFKECMKQFGPVYYALVCIDKLTEHSKGTGFVKFVNIEDAEKCLQAGTELKLLDNILDCHRALEKNELNKKANEKKGTKQKDTRNLYLVKEGVILASSKVAEGVSATDMAKRLQLEQYKTQILRNLNMFISKYRLIIHNIPPMWDDKKLRALFQKHAGSNAVIKEAKIMRDLKKVDANGLGKSKEYGFVTFSTHEDALKALRALNNNPQIFGPNKRPIVAFSIENRVMIKAKQKRLERSRTNNPKCKDFAPRTDNNEINTKPNRKRKLDQDDTLNTYSGVTAKPGIKKMRSKYKLQIQAQTHKDNLKKEKQKKKLGKKTLKEKQKDFTKQPRQKINHKVEKDDFNKLVSSYKKKLYDANINVKKNKWYET